MSDTHPFVLSDEQLLAKWRATGLLRGLDDVRGLDMAKTLQSQLDHLLAKPASFWIKRKQ